MGNPRVLGNSRKGRTSQLTETEKRVLELKRQGLSDRDITAILGWKYPTGKFSAAVEKERIAKIEEIESRKSGTSSLSKARGNTRMDGTK